MCSFSVIRIIKCIVMTIILNVIIIFFKKYSFIAASVENLNMKRTFKIIISVIKSTEKRRPLLVP